MKIHKSYKFRLKPTEEQVAMLKQHGGNTRFVWNKLLDYSNNQYKINNKFPTQTQLQKHIIELKKQYDFIKISHSQPIQINALKLSRTFSRAFKKEVISKRNTKIARAKSEKDETKRNKKLANALNFGFPKFKSKCQNNDNIFYPQNVKFGKARVSFPKMGWINYIKHREILGKQLFSTIVQDGKDYYVTVTCEQKLKEKPKVDLDNSNANIIGIDVGLKTFATFSDGTEIENPRTLKKHLKKLRKESKRLTKKVYDEITHKSSQNRIKQIAVVQKLHKKIRNIRKDFLHKTTHYITTKYDGVAIETLDIQSMLRKNGKAMNRSTADVSWYELGVMLEYKNVWKSKHFVKIDMFYPSTQKCNKCGHQMHLSLEDRMYYCPNCKTVCGRDVNAALNVRDEGIKILKIITNTLATREIKVCGSKLDMKQKQVVDNSAMALAIAV